MQRYLMTIAVAGLAAELMGGIDLMFYVAGYGVLQPIGN